MKINSIRTRLTTAAAALAIGLTGIAAPAMAQNRSPEYEAARKNGTVGEKMDGYLGIVGAGTPALRAMVDELNIERRTVYQNKADAANATLEQYAFTTGCVLISRTEPGEKYQAPDGSWQTRTSAPPMRDSRCP